MSGILTVSYITCNTDMLTGTTVSAVIVVASHVSCGVCQCSLNNVKLQPPVIMKQYSGMSHCGQCEYLNYKYLICVQIKVQLFQPGCSLWRPHKSYHYY
ncbi:hypothetical protein J6590_058310 [Homalodisca vitripennis]|nr:hypothetical protein J6590_058310 [Homalodisca vitripennis]